MFGTLVLIICVACVCFAIVAWFTSKMLIKSTKVTYKARAASAAEAAAENRLDNSEEPLHCEKIQAAGKSFAAKTASFMSNNIGKSHQ